MNPPHPTAISNRRCFRHDHREAVARCPECGRYFCRECITEHESRVLCVNCLESPASADSHRNPRFAGLQRSAQWIAGTVLAWLFFYWLGRILLSLPTAFHEGTLWTAGG